VTVGSDGEIYRRVWTRVWLDAKFRAFDRLTKLAWLHLLSCPEGIAMPGVIPIGIGAVCDALDCTREEADAALATLEHAGMIRRDAALIWMPKALDYQQPDNGNVVAGWVKGWRQRVPETDLAREILRDYASRVSFQDRFIAAFAEWLGNGPPNGSPNGSGNGYRGGWGEQGIGNREKGKERQGSADAPAAPVLTLHPAPEKKKPGTTRQPSRQQLFARWFEEQRRLELGEDYVPDSFPARRVNAELKWITGYAGKLVAEMARLYLADPKKREKDPPCPLRYFVEDWHQYVTRATDNLREGSREA
jgi:hypothetical protein